MSQALKKLGKHLEHLKIKALTMYYVIVSYCSTQSSNFPIQNNKTGNKELNLLENKASRSHGRILYENCTLPKKLVVLHTLFSMLFS